MILNTQETGGTLFPLFVFDLRLDDADHTAKRFLVEAAESFEFFRFEIFVLPFGHRLWLD